MFSAIAPDEARDDTTISTQGVLRPSQKKTGATNLNPTTRLLAETALHQAAAVCMRVHDMRDEYSCLGIPGMLTNIDVQHA